jgi:hypothetical protein
MIIMISENNQHFDWEEFERHMRRQFPYIPDDFWEQMADRHYGLLPNDNWIEVQKQIEKYVWQMLNKLI